MSEWKLIDLCIGKGKYGIAAPAVPKSVNLPTYLRITDINDDGTINKASLCSVDDENSTNYILEENDIVFARTGNSTGRSYFYNKNDGELVYAGFLIKFSLNPNIVNPVILKYYTHSKPYYDWIYSFDTGATRGNINAQTYANMPIILPERDIQDIIVPILSSLDAKIETNNKLNEKLEEMAQAIFKSWFVDFDPFKNQPFHKTELGMIPEGWEVTTFSSIIENLISGDWGKESETGNYVHKVACVRGCDFEDIKNGLRGKTPERFILEKNFESKRPKHNDIIVEMSGGTATVSTGRVCYITKELLDQYEGNIVCTNFCKVVRSVNGWSQFLYYYWQYKYDKKVMFCYENGTSGIKNFSINDFIGMEPICIPQKDSLDTFNSIIDEIRKKIQNNGIESQRLASLRDTLLPRLMSGEIKI